MDKKIYKEIQEQIKKAIEPLEEREIIFVICNKLLYALKHKNLEGCNKNCVAPALIDIAYNKIKKPKTIYQICLLINKNAQINRVSKSYVLRDFRKVKNLLGMQICKEVALMGTACKHLIKPQQYLDNFCKRLGLSKGVNKTAKKILDEYSTISGKISGKSVTGLSISAIYIAALIHGEHKTQREMAEISGNVEPTIRTNYKDMLISLDKDLKKMFRINKDGLN